MTFEERRALIFELALNETESKSYTELQGFYYEDRCDYLESLTDEELIRESLYRSA
jgi:hypothetical protein